jgi:hypothetical protein
VSCHFVLILSTRQRYWASVPRAIKRALLVVVNALLVVVIALLAVVNAFPAHFLLNLLPEYPVSFLKRSDSVMIDRASVYFEKQVPTKIDKD